jgi:hypothetical protein
MQPEYVRALPMIGMAAMNAWAALVFANKHDWVMVVVMVAYAVSSVAFAFKAIT